MVRTDFSSARTGCSANLLVLVQLCPIREKAAVQLRTLAATAVAVPTDPGKRSATAAVRQSRRTTPKRELLIFRSPL